MVNIVWRKLALKQLNSIFEYIKKDSLQSAEKTRTKIFDTINHLKNNTEIYPLDKYRKNNNGGVRAFEVSKCRITYEIKASEIRILRIRHTSREPLSH